MKVIYIAGLYHTGSTLLDLVLGSADNTIGIGETYKGLIDGLENQCSCGKLVNECVFWGGLIESMSADHESIEDKLNKILTHFKNSFGDNTILVDSSKCHPFGLFTTSKTDNFKSLPFYLNNPDIDLKVIHVVRDVRSWSHGLLVRDSRDRNQAKGFQFFYLSMKHIIRLPIFRYLQWYIGHIRIRKFLNNNNADFMTVSYEELALYPDAAITDISEYLGIVIRNNGSSLLQSKSHIAVGNPMRHRESSLKNIKYDARWLKAGSNSCSPLLLTWPIMKFNKKTVYGNLEKYRDK